MKLSWKQLVLVVVSACGLLLGSMASAQTPFPTKPIILVATGTVGGGADVQARLVAGAIDRAGLINEPVAVLNRGTGGSQEGYQFVRQRAGDAHYMLTVTNQFLTYPMVGNAGYDWTDFTPIANLVFDPTVVVVQASSPIQNLQDLIAAAASRGGAMTIGGGQIGTQDHMGFLTLAKVTGINVRYVAFAGGGETHRNILGGQVDVAVGNPSDFLQSVEAGNLRVIAILDEERNPAPLLENVPTAREQGFDATFVVWRGWVAPPGISPELRERLIDLFRTVAEDEAFMRDYVVRFGMRPTFIAGDELTAFIAGQELIYRALLKEAGVIQ
jgi:putative tricarboxylic transport membrane protein